MVTITLSSDLLVVLFSLPFQVQYWYFVIILLLLYEFVPDFFRAAIIICFMRLGEIVRLSRETKQNLSKQQKHTKMHNLSYYITRN